jgi:hypothetical protein
MPYPWPSFGGFLFRLSEHAIWQTDTGWVISPTYVRQRPLGSGTDAIVTTAIGSSERSFDMLLDPQRLQSLQGLLNTKATFTDWRRPAPDSRPAFLAGIAIVQDVIAKESKQNAVGSTNGSIGTYITRRKIQVRITLISA